MLEKDGATGKIVLAGMALLSLGVHLAVNAFGGYGYFRDELYYIACSKHLAAGYVDQPPLSIFVMAVTRLLLGDSVFAIRLVPAMVSSLSVIALCLLVRRLGGKGMAMIIASLCFLASPLLLGTHTYYSMNSLDVLFWLLITHALLGVSESPTLRAWLWLGAILGIGLLNKTSVLWAAAGVVMAILLTDLRRQLRHPGPYLAGALALLIFSPFVIWNLQYGLPHLEFLHNATSGKYSSLTRVRFLTDQSVLDEPDRLLRRAAGALRGVCSTGRKTPPRARHRVPDRVRRAPGQRARRPNTLRRPIRRSSAAARSRSRDSLIPGAASWRPWSPVLLIVTGMACSRHWPCRFCR